MTLTKSKKKILIALGAITILAVVIFLNINIIVITYYYLFKFDHFSAGDKMYLRDEFAGRNKNIEVVRLIKPLTEKEIDTMLVSDHEKAVLKLKIEDPGMKPYILNEPFGRISAPSGKEVIGRYLEDKILRVLTPQHKYVYLHFYAMMPNPQYFKIDTYNQLYPDLPQGYVFADSTYYVFPMLVKNTK